MQFFEPDVKIVEQGHRDTEFMYIVAQGSCKVTTYFYTGTGGAKQDEQLIKYLNVSDYFGEIALVYDSVRSASVTTLNYCTIGKIAGPTLWNLCASYSFFKKALLTQIQLYDDSQRVFLNIALRDIPYLAHCSQDTITTLSMSMKIDFLESGAVYYNVGNEQKCLSIINEGQINLSTVMDNGIPLVLEKLRRGAILGAYNMLIEEEVKVQAVCTEPTVLFTIDRERFTEIVMKDKDLITVLIKEVDEMIESSQSRVLDFIEVKYVIDLPSGETLTGEEAIRASKMSQLLKSTIMTVLVKNRETRKVPKLKDMLLKAITREQKE